MFEACQECIFVLIGSRECEDFPCLGITKDKERIVPVNGYWGYWHIVTTDDLSWA
jgi:hypothetical protein